MIRKRDWVIILVVLLVVVIPSAFGAYDLFGSIFRQNLSRCGELICLWGF
ncbi:uncharacterized protein METZ01_LOCUS266441 [marine metagenome]|uniref:Uncharacterized protein n=1 Tax=marine metagenome TaxID=408172 RepID=A0A382JRE2_9ZZZZ